MTNPSLLALGKLINAIEGGGDIGQPFPQSDLDDLANGAKYIPKQVTHARRQGAKVEFLREQHKWRMPDGTIFE